MAKFYVDKYLIYNTLTDIKKAWYQVALDEKFENIITDEIVTVNLSEWFNSLQLPDGKFIEEDTDIFARVKLYTDNGESPWYLLKPDKSKIVRFYDKDKFVKEKIYNKKNELIQVNEFKKDDNPIDIWFYNTVYKEDFLVDYLDPDEWKIYFGQGINGSFSNKFIDLINDGVEGWLKIGTGEDQGFHNSMIWSLYKVNIKNKYIESRIKLKNVLNSSFVLNFNADDVVIRLANVKSTNKLFKVYSMVIKNGLALGIFEIPVNDKKEILPGALIKDNEIILYNNHKEIGRVENISVTNDAKIEIKAEVTGSFTYGNEVLIDYIKTMEHSGFKVNHY